MNWLKPVKSKEMRLVCTAEPPKLSPRFETPIVGGSKTGVFSLEIQDASALVRLLIAGLWNVSWNEWSRIQKQSAILSLANLGEPTLKLAVEVILGELEYEDHLRKIR